MKNRILMVEDNPVEVRALTSCINAAGFHIELAGDAEHAFARLTSERFDLLLCDLHLPGENGFALCRRVKRLDRLRGMPVVLLTRHSDPLNFLRGLEAGADGFISKGQSATNICERLKRVLSRHQTATDNSPDGIDRIVFLDTAFEITSDRSQVLELLLSGFEDVVLLNAKYEEETIARVASQKSLRDAHAMYLSLVETLTVGIVRKDRDGVYAFANGKACEILGKPLEEIVGKTDLDLYAPEIAEQQRAKDRLVMETGQTQEDFMEYNLESRRCDVSLRRTPVRDSAGQLVGTQIVLTDITELKCTEAELIRSKEAAEEACLAKSQFLASMSHELRTPLNGVIGMTELLMNTELDEQQHRFAMACHSSGKSLLAIINDILDFSKIEAGKLELEAEEFDLDHLLEETGEVMEFQANQRGLLLFAHSSSRLPNRAVGDAVRIRQILVNLIGNAIKFTNDGEINVSVAPRSDGETEFVRFEVSDTGVGIVASQMKKLFEPFTQADNSTSRKYGGTGLGLTICKHLVGMMGGQIGVKSELNVGSTFWFEIPLQQVAAAPKIDTWSHLYDRRVLLLTGSPGIRNFLTSALGGWRMGVEVASSPDDVFQKLQAGIHSVRPFDLVVIEEQPLTATGLSEFLQKRQADSGLQRTKVLLVSSQSSTLAHNHDLGVDRFLYTPLSQSSLLGAVNDCLAARMANDHSVRNGDTSRNHSAVLSTVPGLRVLLAEDNPTNQMFAHAVLEQIGMHCDCVANGEEAVAAVRDHRYALVLMDCQMPGIDGFQATRTIRRMERNGELNDRLRIIALTANAMNGDRERCIEAGMDDYLSKPFEAQQLIRIIAQLFNKKSVSDTVNVDQAANLESTGLGNSADAIPIDHQGLLARCMSNLDLAQALLADFAADLPRRVEEVSQFVAKGDVRAAGEAAHSLKGAAGIIGAEPIRRVVAAIEADGQADRAGQRENVSALLRELNTEARRFVDAVPETQRELASRASSLPRFCPPAGCKRS